MVKHSHHVVTIDITGAYLNATMTSDVYVSINNKISNYLIQLNEDYENYLNQN